MAEATKVFCSSIAGAEATKVFCPSIAEAARWKGKVTAKILCFTPEKVWPFFEDFGNLHKIDPKVDVSYALEGVYGHAGLIRFCSAHTTTKSPSGENEIAIQWSHEKLLSMDPAKYSFTYEILENNVGFTYCRSTIKVLQLKGCCEFGSELEWTYESDPLPGQKPDYLSKYFGANLQAMADTIKKTLEARSKCCIC